MGFVAGLEELPVDVALKERRVSVCEHEVAAGIAIVIEVAVEAGLGIGEAGVDTAAATASTSARARAIFRGGEAALQWVRYSASL